MDRSYWHKQTTEALFPDLLWSRPENRLHAGKLLVIGGNAHGFSAVASAYNEAVKARIGTARVLLPDSIQRVVKAILETADYAPSTPSGSFSQKALSELLLHAGWADGILLAGDLGRNSETAILLESFLSKYDQQLTITKDAVDYFTAHPRALLGRRDTCLVVTMAQLQKLAQSSLHHKAITFGMDLLHLVDWLHEFTTAHPVHIIVKHLQNIYVASGGQVSSTMTTLDNEDIWRVPTAARAAVWWLQNPSKTFEALTTAVAED